MATNTTNKCKCQISNIRNHSLLVTNQLKNKKLWKTIQETQEVQD